MTNEVAFAALAHNLQMKTDGENTFRHAHKNHMASMLVYPQAVRKRRYTRLDLAFLTTSWKDTMDSTHTMHNAECEDQKAQLGDHFRPPRSISQPAARSKLTYD